VSCSDGAVKPAQSLSLWTSVKTSHITCYYYWYYIKYPKNILKG